MSRRKAGMCKCGHELKRFHNAEGVCTYGEGTLHGARCAVEYAGPCSKARKKPAPQIKLLVGIDQPEVFAMKLNKEEIGALRITRKVIDRILAAHDKISGVARHQKEPAMLGAPSETKAVEATRQVHTTVLAPNGALGRCATMLLGAIAQRHPKPTSRAQAALMSGYRVTSSTFRNGMSELRTAGLIAGNGDYIKPTDEGLRVAPAERLPTGEALFRFWSAKLDLCSSSLLEALFLAGKGRTVERSALGEQTNYSPDSSTFRNGLSKLRTLQLASGSRELRASEELFS